MMKSPDTQTETQIQPFIVKDMKANLKDLSDLVSPNYHGKKSLVYMTNTKVVS